MTVARNVADVLAEHVAFEVECIDHRYAVQGARARFALNRSSISWTTTSGSAYRSFLSAFGGRHVTDNGCSSAAHSFENDGPGEALDPLRCTAAFRPPDGADGRHRVRLSVVLAHVTGARARPANPEVTVGVSRPVGCHRCCGRGWCGRGWLPDPHLGQDRAVVGVGLVVAES